MRRAVYPGSFDPITFGHVDLTRRAAEMFDEVIVAIADNPNKKVMFSHEERREMAAAALAEIKNARVIVFRGLLANLVEQEDCCAIVRGMRAVSDFEYEFQMALMNRKLAREVETVFLMPSLSWVYLSSSIVREVAKNGGDVTGLVPTPVKQALVRKFKRGR